MSEKESYPMTRTDVNPWEWTKMFGFSQAVDVGGADRVPITHD